MERGEKIVVGVLAVAIIAAVGVFAYYELPGDDSDGCGDTVLTVSYQGEEWTYTLCELKDMDSTTGQGGMKTKAGITDPSSFQGVSFATLLADIDVLPTAGLQATVIAADGWSQTFDTAAITGNVTTYDATGNITNDTVQPLPMFAYRQDGNAISDDDGPIRVAYVAAQPVYTSSRYWVKQVVRVNISHAITVSYNGTDTVYTRDDLAALEALAGDGGMKTKAGTAGPWTFTGVSFTTLLQDAGVADVNSVNMTVVAADGWSQTFDAAAIGGDLPTYDASGNETTGDVALTSMLAYQQNGTAIDMDDGPFRVALVASPPVYTSSRYWVKQVVHIDVEYL